MKKILEAELMSLAHRVLQLRGRADLDELKEAAGELHEKLAILSFTEKYFDGPQPTIGRKKVATALGEKNSPSPQKKPEKTPQPQPEKENPDTLNESETGKKDIPREAQPEKEEQTAGEDKRQSKAAKILAKNQEAFEKSEQHSSNPKGATNKPSSENLRDMAVHYDDLPQFERVQQSEHSTQKTPKPPKHTEKTAGPPTENPSENQAEAKKTEPPKRENDLFSASREQTRNDLNPHKKSLNEKLHHGLNFGLNDRLAFIKHLFEGNATDFERVISQLNTVQNFSEAKVFIEQQVKPDYDWENEEEFETRFLNAVKKRIG